MRDLSLDAFKGLLVIGMVTAHVIQFYAAPSPALGIVSLLVNLISFSGFLFAFGYANWHAYLSRDPAVARPRMLATAWKTLGAFYLSGLAYRLIVDEAPLTLDTFLRVLTLTDIPYYSEFLLAFALITLLATLALRLLRALVERPAAFWVVVAACLAAGLVRIDMDVPQLGIFIGADRPFVYPVLQYAPWYLVGVWFARHGTRLDWRTGAAALACTALFGAAYVLGGGLPSRFPPSTFWVIGSAAVLWVYLWGARRITWQPHNLLVSMGENVLLCLLLSNLLIFGLEASRPAALLGVGAIVGVTALIITACSFFTGIVRPRAARR